MRYSYTTSSTFTITHARHLSSKVAADMHLCHAYYGRPSESIIPDYAEELAQLLRHGYLDAYEFGFKKNGLRFLTWRYVVLSDGSLSSDDRAGKLLSTFDVSGGSFFNFTTPSMKWFLLGESERSKFESDLPIKRSTGEPPKDGDGYWTSTDRNYSSGGVGMGRSTYRPR